MSYRSVENWLWKPAILIIIGMGLILSGVWFPGQNTGGSDSLIITQNVSADEVPADATVSEYEELDSDFQGAFRKAVEELDSGRTPVVGTFESAPDPVDSGDYIHYKGQYYEVSTLHGDRAAPENILWFIVPGVGLIVVALGWSGFRLVRRT